LNFQILQIRVASSSSKEEKVTVKVRIFVFFMAFLGLSAAVTRPAVAGCHTSCTSVQPPGCLGCGFLIYSNVICLRGDCNFCTEDYCSVALPVPSDRLATSPETVNPVPRVTVEVLVPRS
jgi:hypothetical protein